jgi:hypothetical protein
MHKGTLIIMTTTIAAILATSAFAFALPNQAFALHFGPGPHVFAQSNTGHHKIPLTPLKIPLTPLKIPLTPLKIPLTPLKIPLTPLTPPPNHPCTPLAC